MHVGIELCSSGNIESYTHYRSGKYGEKQGLFTVERVSINTVDDGECTVIQLVFLGIEELW